MPNFNGTNGNDIFTGGNDNDTAVGNGGNDTLSGAGGNDLLVGNSGSDVLNGGDGEDRLFSGDESPPFNIPYYNNPYTPPLLDTGSEHDVLNGGEGSDRLFAGYGDDVDGGGDGTYGGDYLYISFLGAPAGITVDFRLASQTIGGGTITGIENISWVQGSNFSDSIDVRSNVANGYSDFTAVFGMAGNDTLIAGYYTGVLDGGADDDIVDGRGSQYLQAVYGGAGNDILYTNSNTFAAAYGGDGNDTIYAHGETHGGDGNDQIVISFSYYGGRVYGEAGDDQIQAAESGSVIAGGTGADIINGHSANDQLGSADFGTYPTTFSDDIGLEQDVIAGFGGNDLVSIGYGDSADGGSGSDTLRLSIGGLGTGITFSTSGLATGQPTTIGGGTIQNFEVFEYLRGTDYADSITVVTQSTLLTINAGAGDDIVISQNSSVALSGGQGNDRFISGAAGDSFDGGSGIDTVDYQQAAGGITVTLGANGSAGTGPGGDSLISVENIHGSGFGDNLTGNELANELRGQDGNDTLSGNAGSDSLFGGGGNDSLNGGVGNDTLDGEDGTDQLAGGAGDDLYFDVGGGDSIIELAGEGLDAVSTAALLYSLAANVENLTFTGAGAFEGVGNQLANRINSTQGTGNHILRGLGGNDDLYAGNGDDLLEGGDGADIMSGGGGNDTLEGGEGSDLLSGDQGDDILVGGGSFDSADYSNSGAGVTVDLSIIVGQNTIASGVDTLSGIEGLIGSFHADVLRGDGGNNLLDGRTGADTLQGRGGDDSYQVDNVGDVVIEEVDGGLDSITSTVNFSLPANVEILSLVSDSAATTATGNALNNTLLGNFQANDLSGGSGDDFIAGNSGSDILRGDDGQDRLFGESGADNLFGNAGDDTLTGGAEFDVLTGGAGADSFMDTASGLNGDTITDFGTGDRIVISDASLANFSFARSGNTLTFTGGSVTLQGGIVGRLVATAAASGGVQLTLQPYDASNDVNGDSRSDLVWRNADGSFATWLGQPSGSLVPHPGSAANVLAADWQIRGIGDFNGDGREDILWRHSSGEIGEWLGQSNGIFTNNGGAAANPVDNSWSVAGVADYNGDGRDDILWRHSSGAVGQWLGQPSGGFINNGGAAANAVDTSWSIVASGDFNGDARADVLWRHSSGALALWQGSSSGALTNSGAVLAGAPGLVVGAGDFNGDGRDDVLMRAGNGSINLWLGQANGQFASLTPASQVLDLNWKIAGIGDYNGDGRDDLIWRHASGLGAEWLATPTGNFVHNGAIPTIDPSWQIQSPDLWPV